MLIENLIKGKWDISARGVIQVVFFTKEGRTIFINSLHINQQFLPIAKVAAETRLTAFLQKFQILLCSTQKFWKHYVRVISKSFRRRWSNTGSNRSGVGLSLRRPKSVASYRNRNMVFNIKFTFTEWYLRLQAKFEVFVILWSKFSHKIRYDFTN